jgi:two-component system, LytTR family, sensor kinase
LAAFYSCSREPYNTIHLMDGHASEDTRMKSQTPRLLWIALFWLGIGLFDATQTVFAMRAEGMHHNWTALFVTSLLSWIPWAIATPLVLRLQTKHSASHWKEAGFWLRHMAACAAVGCAFAGWISIWDKLLNPFALASVDPFLRLWWEKFFGGLLSFVILYGVILLVGHILDSQERLARQQTETARLNEQLSKAQLNLLRRQIEPHFLFNALNAIAGLVREERSDAAISMIAELSDFLRRVIDDSNRQEVALGEELEFALKYLDIQKVRFAERLQVSVSVPSDLYSARVPSLILQPMVENAVKHGIAKRIQGGLIRIRAFPEDEKVTVSVYNDGPTLPQDWETKQGGIGLANVRTRLKSLYGEAFNLTLRNQEPGGVEVSISVPLQEQPVVSS